MERASDMTVRRRGGEWFVGFNPILAVLIIVGISTACSGNRQRVDDPTPGTRPPTVGTENHRSDPDPPAVDIDSPESGPVFFGARIGERPIELEVADDNRERGLGLGGRKKLETDCGMIFVYPEADTRSFYMKGCLIGLDIAYVDDERRIFQIGSLDRPTPAEVEAGSYPSYASTGPARYVIEMAKGWFASRGIGSGTLVEFSDALDKIVAENRGG